jgi:hypothetical protein
MGSSALRGMAYAKPLVVQGDGGFWRLASPENQALFLEHGWFGHGPGGDGAGELERILDPVLRDPGLRAELGRYGRGLVESRFSLEQAAGRLVGVYREACRDKQPARTGRASLARTAYEVAKFRAVIHLQSAGPDRGARGAGA